MKTAAPFKSRVYVGGDVMFAVSDASFFFFFNLQHNDPNYYNM